MRSKSGSRALFLGLCAPILLTGALLAGAAAADPVPASDAQPAAAAADGPISTGRDQSAPPKPAPGQTPAILLAPPGEDPTANLLPNDPRDKRIHGEVGAGFDSRGGHAFWGSAYGPIGDNGYAGISVYQDKGRW